MALFLSSSCLIGHGGFWLTHTHTGLPLGPGCQDSQGPATSESVRETYALHKVKGGMAEKLVQIRQTSPTSPLSTLSCQESHGAFDSGASLLWAITDPKISSEFQQKLPKVFCLSRLGFPSPGTTLFCLIFLFSPFSHLPHLPPDCFPAFPSVSSHVLLCLTFIYLAVLDLSCSSQDLCSSLGHVNS